MILPAIEVITASAETCSEVSIVIDQDIAGLKVAVHHAALVGVGDCLADFIEKLYDLAGGQLPNLDEIIQRHAFYVLHGVIILPVCDAAVVDRYDVRVAQARGQVHFPLKAELRSLGSVQFLQQYLHRDDALGGFLVGLIYDRLAAGGQALQKLVTFNRRDQIRVNAARGIHSC
jgi:hypothetical protein